MFQVPLEFYAYSSLFTSIVCFAIAAFVLYRRPGLPATRLFSCLSFLIAIWSWFYFLWLRETTDAIKADLLVRTCMLPVMLMPSVWIHFVVVFTKQKVSRFILVGNYVLSTLLSLMVYTPMFSNGVGPHLVFPFWPFPKPIFFIHLSQFIICIIYGLWIMWKAANRSEGLHRTQLLWTFWAFLIGWSSGGTNYFAWLRVPILPILNPLVSIYVTVIAYAILRHQFFNIRVVISRALVYSLLVACITATYLVVVLIAEKWFQGLFGYHSLPVTVVVAFFVAIFFNPLRDRIQAFVDRALFKATPAELAAQREKLLTEVRKGDQMKAVATLAAGLAHEIKNPLTSVKTFTEHLETRYKDPVFRSKFQKIVGGEVERINLIVQQLLEFAKPVPPKLAPVEVPRLIDETLEFLNNDLVTHHIGVTRHYQGQGRALADPRQLKQVFLNLFLNSLQAMNGAGELSITTKSQPEANLVVTIKDNGRGICPKDLPHIFDPFYTTRASGTGLGLAVVQGIIQEHKGRIEVESRIGQGTTVNLVLPRSVELG